MSDKAVQFWTVFNGTAIGLIALVIVALLCWMARDLFWYLYDKHMQNSRRIRNNKLDSAHRTGMFTVGRDVRGKL